MLLRGKGGAKPGRRKNNNGEDKTSRGGNSGKERRYNGKGSWAQDCKKTWEIKIGQCRGVGLILRKKNTNCRQATTTEEQTESD